MKEKAAKIGKKKKTISRGISKKRKDEPTKVPDVRRTKNKADGGFLARDRPQRGINIKKTLGKKGLR